MSFEGDDEWGSVFVYSGKKVAEYSFSYPYQDYRLVWTLNLYLEEWSGTEWMWISSS